MEQIFNSAHISWLDIGFLAVMLISAAVGAWRGLVFEILALAGWIFAWLASQMFGAQVGRILNIGLPGSALQTLIGLAASFFLVLIVWTLLASLIRALVAATPLSGLDRLLGSVFGLIRGLLLLLLVVMLVSLTPVAKSGLWQQSQGVQAVTVVMNVVRPILPETIHRHLPV